jgi:hypothetical protein
MQEILVVLFIVFAIVYLGKKVFYWLKPKPSSCYTCSFGQASQNKS